MTNNEDAINVLGELQAQINRVMIGQREVVQQIMIALLANGHVLIEGVPGLGKTLLVKTLASTFNGTFKRIQFTPDLMPADITGHVMYDMKESRFHMREGPVFCHLLLADEINRAPAKSQAALLEVMQERQVTLDGESRPMPLPFMVLATQNPIEQEGTYPLPEAELDRFLMKIYIDYPGLAEEVLLTETITTGHIDDGAAFANSTAMITPETMIALQQLAANIAVDAQVMDYAVRLVRATRDNISLFRGAGPRASIALIRSARALALLNGYNFVSPDDVKQMALPVMRHRVSLTADMEIEGADTDGVLRQLFDSIDAPRI